MRPKASPQHLQIAAAFANAVTIRSSEPKLNNEVFPFVVKCKGPTSVFSALKVCIPDIVRSSNDYSYTIKDAVSEIELNKFLVRSGYVSLRHRSRVKGTKDKWTKGFQRWRFLRWLDPRNPEELSQLKENIAEIPNRFPGSYSIHETELVHFILNLESIDDEIQFLCVGDNSMLGIEFDREENIATEYDRWHRDQSSPEFPPRMGGADDPSRSPRFADLQLAAPGTLVAPRRWHVDAIPFTRFATHHRLVRLKEWLPTAALPSPLPTPTQAPPAPAPTIF
jgi:hypothetical protein